MFRRRSAAALSAILLLAACSEAAAPAAADPKAVLGAATAGLTAGNYRYTIDMPGTRIEGVTDLATSSAAWTTTMYHTGVQEIEIRLIGQDQYTATRRDATNIVAEKKNIRKIAASTNDPGRKADLAASMRELDTADTRFRHLDLSRIPEAAARMGLTLTDPDRTAATKLLSNVQSATADGRTIRGTLSINGPLGGDIALAGLEQRLLGAPVFTANVDEQGKLSRLEVDLPASTHPVDPEGRWTVTIDGYGTTPAPTKPTAVQETAQDVYDSLRP